MTRHSPAVRLSELTEAIAVTCPACDRTLAIVDQKGTKQAVTEASRLRIFRYGLSLFGHSETVAGMGVACFVFLDKCPYCGVRHWYLDVTLDEGDQGDVALAQSPGCDSMECWITVEPIGQPWFLSDGRHGPARAVNFHIGPMLVPSRVLRDDPDPGCPRVFEGLEPHALDMFNSVEPQLRAVLEFIKTGE